MSAQERTEDEDAVILQTTDGEQCFDGGMLKAHMIIMVNIIK